MAFGLLLGEIQQQCVAAVARQQQQRQQQGGELEAGEVRADGMPASGPSPVVSRGGPVLPAWDSGLTLEALEQLWGADSRWQRCPPSQRRKVFEERMAGVREAEAAAARAAYRALLKEAGLHAGSRWSRTKEAIRWVG